MNVDIVKDSVVASPPLVVLFGVVVFRFLLFLLLFLLFSVVVVVPGGFRLDRLGGFLLWFLQFVHCGVVGAFRLCLVVVVVVTVCFLVGMLLLNHCRRGFSVDNELQRFVYAVGFLVGMLPLDGGSDPSRIRFCQLRLLFCHTLTLSLVSC